MHKQAVTALHYYFGLIKLFLGGYEQNSNNFHK